MEFLILLAALALVLVLVMISRFTFEPNDLSEFELHRRADKGDKEAIYELRRRPLLAPLDGLRTFKIAIVVAITTVLLVSTYGVWLGLALIVLYLLLAQLIIANGWMDGQARRFQATVDPYMLAVAAPLTWLFKHFTPRTDIVAEHGIASREDLADMIARDKEILTATEKAKLLGALEFARLKVSDAMVTREKIVTVGVGETVGPVLLDRLHKVGHKIFVVVKKDLDHVQGLLYVADIAQAHPDLKTVKDAVRPSVHYIAAHMPLSAILVASLQSGRQLFIVVDENGNIQGLITLRDALVKLLGTAPPDEIYTSTDPKKVKKI